MDKIKLTGLWKKESSDGVFFQGNLGYGAQVLIFRNGYKKGEKDPDLILYVAKSEKLEKREGASADAGADPFAF